MVGFHTGQWLTIPRGECPWGCLDAWFVGHLVYGLFSIVAGIVWKGLVAYGLIISKGDAYSDIRNEHDQLSYLQVSHICFILDQCKLWCVRISCTEVRHASPFEMLHIHVGVNDGGKWLTWLWWLHFHLSAQSSMLPCSPHKSWSDFRSHGNHHR